LSVKTNAKSKRGDIRKNPSKEMNYRYMDKLKQRQMRTMAKMEKLQIVIKFLQQVEDKNLINYLKTIMM
jgi:hypothetical protein